MNFARFFSLTLVKHGLWVEHLADNSYNYWFTHTGRGFQPGFGKLLVVLDRGDYAVC